MIAQFIANIHNAWLGIPVGVRLALAFSGATFIGVAQTFGWTFPHSLSEAQAELVAFVAVAAPVMVAVIQTTIAPALAKWFLSTFGYVAPQNTLTGPAHLRDFGSGRWIKAA